jgi:hypothetical protein
MTSPNILLAVAIWLGLFAHPEHPEERVYVLRDGNRVSLSGNKAAAGAVDPMLARQPTLQSPLPPPAPWPWDRVS